MLKLAILNPRQYGIKVSDLLRASVVGLRLDVAYSRGIPVYRKITISQVQNTWYYEIPCAIRSYCPASQNDAFLCDLEPHQSSQLLLNFNI